MEWGTVLSVAGLFVLGVGYLAHHINRLDASLSKCIESVPDSLPTRMDRLEQRLDNLTQRHIAHFEDHPQ